MARTNAFRKWPSRARRIEGVVAIRPIGAYLAVVGGTLMVAAAFLPWFLVTGLGSISLNGFHLGYAYAYSADGSIAVLLGVVTVFMGVSRLVYLKMSNVLQRLTLITGTVAGWLAVASAINIQRTWVDVVNSSSLSNGSIGYGLWVFSTGAALAIGAGIVVSSHN